jgi:hypothetical protein
MVTSQATYFALDDSDSLLYFCVHKSEDVTSSGFRNQRVIIKLFFTNAKLSVHLRKIGGNVVSVTKTYSCLVRNSAHLKRSDPDSGIGLDEFSSIDMAFNSFRDFTSVIS